MGRSWWHRNCYKCRDQFDDDDANQSLVMCKKCSRYYCIECLQLNEDDFYDDDIEKEIEECIFCKNGICCECGVRKKNI